MGGGAQPNFDALGITVERIVFLAKLQGKLDAPVAGVLCGRRIIGLTRATLLHITLNK